MQDNTEKDIVYMCVNCKGLKLCWCGDKEYIKMWEFVYRAFKSCKPTI